MDINTVLAMQDRLSTYQAIPVAGAIFVSPVKAMVSTVQTVVGVAAAIFFAAAGLLLKDDDYKYRAGTAVFFAASGFLHGLYSVINLLSLSYIGYHNQGNDSAINNIIKIVQQNC